MKKYIAFGLVLAMMLSLAGCYQVQAADLMDGVKANAVDTVPLDNEAAAVTDFGVRLFQQSFTAGENTLISPFSVLCALSMTANGAKGETLAQMEQVFGLDVQTLNLWLHSYVESLPQEESLTMANAIWFRDDPGFTADPEFLQRNADYYGAGIYKAPFDGSTRKDINHFVEENTNGMIREILDEIPDDAVMYLVNALAFDAKWQTEYEKSDIREDLFHLSDAEGTSRNVEMMHSTEGKYLEDAHATGFIKYYKGSDYAFVALLPNEGVSLEEYVASLTGEHLHSLLSNPENTTVYAGIPKFEAEYSCEMADILQAMGMKDAFDYRKADFSALGTSERGNLSISRVLHKTYISVDEKGTKAAASTVVEVTDACAVEVIEEYQTVILDRPFLYMLIDTQNNMPFFIGTVMDVEG